MCVHAATLTYTVMNKPVDHTQYCTGIFNTTTIANCSMVTLLLARGWVLGAGFSISVYITLTYTHTQPPPPPHTHTVVLFLLLPQHEPLQVCHSPQVDSYPTRQTIPPQCAVGLRGETGVTPLPGTCRYPKLPHMTRCNII